MPRPGLDPAAVEGLLQWFANEARDLPWRTDRSPYRVWISEIMLQQTQVETVIPYYQRFLQAFPRVEELAAADEDRLMALWAGLGYYSRARNLQKAALPVVREHGGVFPEEPSTVRALPGFGDYTTAAVLSLSMGQDLAVLDGNVARVLARVFLVEGSVKTGPVRKQLQALADAGLPTGRAGSYNEALMELGARVCRPKPRCAECPLQPVCGAFREGCQEEFPSKNETRVRPCHPCVVLVVRNGKGQVLLHRREGKGLLGGLWELPSIRSLEKLDTDPATPDQLAPLLAQALAGLPGAPVGAAGPERCLPVFRHHYSHFSIEVHPQEIEREVQELPADWRWVSVADRDGLGISASDRRILEDLGA